MSDSATATPTIIVTCDRAEDARRAPRAMLDDTDLPPRLRRLSRRLSMGKSAVAAEVPADDDKRATRALLRFAGADAAR